jgi:hypothetical protein
VVPWARLLEFIKLHGRGQAMVSGRDVWRRCGTFTSCSTGSISDPGLDAALRDVQFGYIAVRY